MAKKATIDVYYDLLSPYAWAAFEALCYYRTTWNVEVRAKPFLLAAVMGGSGNKPPMTIPRKGAYLCKDLQRLGHYYGVPFNKGMLETSSSTPFANPMESLIPMRFLLSLEQSRPELVENAARELWTQKWCRAQNFDQTEYLQQVTKKLGLDNQESDNVLSNCHNSVIKQQLNKNTEDALKCGAFGAPWIVVHLKGQSYEFFGPYRFHFIADLLGEEIPEKTQKTVPNTRSRVDLFFDVISPYSWIGFEALCRYRAVWNIDLHFRPFLLGALLKETGNKMPSILPAKKAYIYKDIERVRSYWSVPLTFLKDIKESMFVKGSLAAQRYLTSLNRVQPERLEDAARELWMRRWSRDQDIHLPQHLQQVSETIGLSTSVSEKVISDMELPEVKEMLKWTTQEAVDEGAFGAPWSVVHMNGEKHSFFGSDRFHIMARLLGETFPGPMFAREYCTIMGKKTQVDLYFDVISPYAWIGFEALCRYCSVWNIDLHLRPYSLAHIMKATGNQPPALVLARGAYLLEDLMRMREYWSIPINKMKDTNDAMFNKGSLAANRYLISLSIIEPDRVEEAARELWMRRWSRDQDFHLAENLVEVSNTLGLSDELTEKVIAGIDTDETKDKLKANTDEALKEGAFGAPWIVVHHPNGKNYSFFGSDRFPLIAHILGETFPGPMRELAKTKL